MKDSATARHLLQLQSAEEVEDFLRRIEGPTILEDDSRWLADMAPPEAAQEGPQGGWCLDYAADSASCPAGAQHVGIVNAVAPSQRGGHQGQHLVSRVRPPRRMSEVKVAVDQFTETQVLGEGHRKEQPSIGHQAVVVEGYLDAVGVLKWQHLLGAPCFWLVSFSKTIIPEAREHLLAASEH